MKKLKPLKQRGYPNDPQVLAVYRFEGRWVHWNETNASLGICRALIRRACELYGVKTPTVTWGPNTEPYKPKSRPCTYFDPNINTILLRKRHWNYSTALHEVAHCIVWHRFGHQRIDHGPTWLGIYLWLLAANHTAPIVALEAAARLDGLEWAPILESSPRAIRKLKVTPP